MASPLDEAVKGFVDDVFGNETLTNSDRKQIILFAMLSLENKIDDGTNRWGMSMSLSALGKDARQPRKKHLENKKGDIDEFDVDEMGC